MPNLARPSPTSESARCECREGSPGCRPDSGYVVVLEDNHRAERLVDLVAGDHLGCHLAYSPCIVVGGSDDGSCSSPIPGMQQAAGGPHPGPVAVLRSRTAGEHVLGWRSAQRQDQVIVNLAAFQQVDASGDHSWLPPTCALGLDALAWRHPGPAHHDQSVAPVNPDLLPVRHARTVGNHRWPAWLPLSRSVRVGCDLISLWSALVVSVQATAEPGRSPGCGRSAGLDRAAPNSTKIITVPMATKPTDSANAPQSGVAAINWVHEGDHQHIKRDARPDSPHPGSTRPQRQSRR